jgi:hypothetical protein
MEVKLRLLDAILLARVKSRGCAGSRIVEVATRFKVKHVKLFITCMQFLRAHPRHLTRASELASCKRRLNNDKSFVNCAIETYEEVEMKPHINLSSGWR